MFANKRARESDSGLVLDAFCPPENMSGDHEPTLVASDTAGDAQRTEMLRPAPQAGEAAALVARLLSGCDQQPVALAAASTASREPVTAVPALFATEMPRIADLPTDPKDSVVPDRARALPRDSNQARWLMIVSLAMLVFGAGLAVGYGVLGRNSKAATRPRMQGVQQAAIHNGAVPQRDDDQTSVPSAARAPTVNPTVSLPPAGSGLHAEEHTEDSSEKASGKYFETPPTQARNAQDEHAMGTHPGVPDDSSVSDKSLASIEPDSRQRPATTAQDSRIGERPPSSDVGAQTLETTAQPAQLESTPIDPARTQDAGHVRVAPDTGDATALSEKGPGAPATQMLPDARSNEPSEPSVASGGHIEPCQLIHSVRPVYPQKAQKLHVEGDVQLRVVVAVDGTVRYVGLVSGPPLLVMAAIDAARGFRYRPALLNGKPIETVQSVYMAFKLKN